MRRTTEPVCRDLPPVTGARRLLASGELGAELVRLSQGAAALDRRDAARPAPAEAPERPIPTPEWLVLSGARR